MSAYSAIIGKDRISFKFDENPAYSGQLPLIPQGYRTVEKQISESVFAVHTFYQQTREMGLQTAFVRIHMVKLRHMETGKWYTLGLKKFAKNLQQWI